jgi:hypothetical protein
MKFFKWKESYFSWPAIYSRFSSFRYFKDVYRCIEFCKDLDFWKVETLIFRIFLEVSRELYLCIIAYNETLPVSSYWNKIDLIEFLIKISLFISSLWDLNFHELCDSINLNKRFIFILSSWLFCSFLQQSLFSFYSCSYFMF